MGSISDIFGDATPDKGVVSPLQPLAQRAADLADELYHANQALENERAILMADVTAKLAREQANVDHLREVFGRVKQDLLDGMVKDKIDVIPLDGRGPVRVKTTPGAKKNVTKGFLDEQLGVEKTKELWKKLGHYPDKTDVIIPVRNEPS